LKATKKIIIEIIKIFFKGGNKKYGECRLDRIREHGRPYEQKFNQSRA
jgi:hypothetical protein